MKFLDLSSYEKRADWITNLSSKWKKAKKDMDQLIDVCIELILENKKIKKFKDRIKELENEIKEIEKATAFTVEIPDSWIIKDQKN